MNAFKSHGKGRLVLKGTFGGIRVERSSGTDDPKMLRRITVMCEVLASGGRLDLVRSVSLGLFRPLELWEHFRVGRWQDLPSPDLLRPLKPTLEAWRDRQKNRHTRKSAQSYINRILEHAKDGATLWSLKDALQAYRTACDEAKQGQSFNHVRSAALAMIRTTEGLGRHSQLWNVVSAIDPLSYTSKRDGNPQRPADAWVIAQQLGAIGQDWWAMCCTGMGPGEYFEGKWKVDGRLYVHGTKRAARARVVPLIWDIKEPVSVSAQMFEKRLREAGLGVVPNDGRKSFAIWLAECEIPEHRQQAYMGHGPKTMTQRYQRVKEQYLDEDEARLRALIGGISGGTPGPDAPQIGVIPAQFRPPVGRVSHETNKGKR